MPAVTYADADDEQVAESSLMMVANGQLSPTPPTSWRCYTAAGAAGARVICSARSYRATTPAIPTTSI